MILTAMHAAAHAFRRTRATFRRLVGAGPARASSAADPVGRAARWAGRQLGDLAHERRVAALALQLFDLTRDRHGLGANARQLLEIAALVHDVGRAVDEDRHEKVGAALVQAAGAALPLSEHDRQLVAYLTRRHRGPIGRASTDRWAKGLRGATALPLLALLRTADGLDARDGSARTTRLLRLGGRIVCELSRAPDSSRKRRRLARSLDDDKFALLGKLGLTLEVRFPAEARSAKAPLVSSARA